MPDALSWATAIAAFIAAIGGILATLFGWAALKRKTPVVMATVQIMEAPRGWALIRYTVVNRSDAPVLLRTVRVAQPGDLPICAENGQTKRDEKGELRSFIQPLIPVNAKREVTVDQTFHAGGTEWAYLFAHLPSPPDEPRLPESIELEGTFSWMDRIKRRFRIRTHTMTT